MGTATENRKAGGEFMACRKSSKSAFISNGQRDGRLIAVLDVVHRQQGDPDLVRGNAGPETGYVLDRLPDRPDRDRSR
ncbi:hypothetical protein [uncultured Ruegeria sp.]|uniref:hypothetical protein n=1 Tax=uncultured Ruegeria sp. TaxID=259304 RepID=UPI002634E142|nr:hypothetical protein [uncultured Ruegeria sp.]